MVALVSLEIDLSNDGVVVVVGTASSGEEAVRLLPDARADVIVLDYRMPDADGLEVAARILRDEPTQNIILFSAYINDRMEEAAERVGIRECVSKDRYMDLPVILRKYQPIG